MPVADFKKNSNSKDINKKSKKIKSIFNSNLSEEAEKNSLIHSSTPHQNNTHKNSNKTHKSPGNTQKDKKKPILKDLKLHSQISKKKETNLLKKDSIMILLTETT